MRFEDLMDEYRESPLPQPLAIDEALQQLHPKSNARRRAQWTAGLAIAASLLFAAFWLRPRAIEPTPPPPTRAATPSVISIPSATAPAQPKRITSHKVRALAKRAPAVEDWSGFVALPEAQFLPRPESLQLVRASVSEQRLQALGLLAGGFTPGRDPGELQVDLMLGPDGLARAMRVVDRADR
jgi:hypothetical protein